MIWPGTEIVISPPYAHWHVDVFVSAGRPITCTIGEPGCHGAGITGVHGIGVRTPSAAAVALATAGLARLVQRENGPTFTNGTMSMTVATGAEHAVVPVGTTFRTPGAAPKVQRVDAPLVTTAATSST